MGDHEQPTTGSAAAETIRVYAKGIIATAVAFLGSLATALADGEVTQLEWVGIASTTLVAAGAVISVANGQRASEQTTAGYPDGLKSEPDDALG